MEGRMMMADDGGYAFPNPALANEAFQPSYDMGGMSLRDWLAGQAVASGACNGFVPEQTLAEWFGDETGIRTERIVARQAVAIADALIAALATS